VTRLDEFFEAVFGDGHGYAALSFGRRPNVAVFYEWPSQRRQLVTDAKRRSKAENVFYCPALRTSTATSEGGGLVERLNPPVEPMPCLWADIDLVGKDGEEKKINHTLLDELNPIRVQSGHEGHLHVYVPLLEGVDAATHKTLNTALKNALGGDHKQNSVSWLRLPGTINHKSDLDRPPVKLIKVRGTRHNVDDLSASLAPWMTRSRDYTNEHVEGVQHVDWASLKRRLPDNVRRAFADDDTGDGRGVRTYALVAACRESKIRGKPISLDETIVIAEHFPPAIDKYDWRDGGVAKQVEDCWNNYSRKSTQVNSKPTPARHSRKKADKERIDNVVDERRTSWTWVELDQQTFPELWWGVPGFIPEGLTLLVAAPKVGKSYLTMNLAVAIVAGAKILGSIEGERGEVLVIPLDDPSDRRMQTRTREIAEALELKPTDGLYLEFDWPTLAEGGGELLDEWLSDHPNCRMVIIDTLSRLRDAETRRSADPGKVDEQAMAEFKKLADKHRVAIVGTHHDRKNDADDFLDMVSGNKKLTGGADTIIYVKRKRNQPGASAHVTGRDIEEQELHLRFDFPLWNLIEEPAKMETSDIRIAIADYLHEKQKGTAAEIARHLGEPTNKINQRLYHMKHDGEVHQPAGARTPYRLTRAYERRAYSKINNNDNDVMRGIKDDSLRDYNYYGGSASADARTREQGATGFRKLTRTSLQPATVKEVDFSNVDRRFHRKTQ
jgi:hypothetical protein